MKKFDEFINEDIETDMSDIDIESVERNILFKSHMKNMMKYIMEKYDGEIEHKFTSFVVYGTSENDESVISFRTPITLANKINEWVRSTDYLDHVDTAATEINKIVEIIRSLDIDCAVQDYGDATHFRIDIINSYFDDNKDLLKGLSTIKKFDL